MSLSVNVNNCYPFTSEVQQRLSSQSTWNTIPDSDVIGGSSLVVTVTSAYQIRLKSVSGEEPSTVYSGVYQLPASQTDVPSIIYFRINGTTGGGSCNPLPVKIQAVNNTSVSVTLMQRASSKYNWVTVSGGPFNSGTTIAAVVYQGFQLQSVNGSTGFVSNTVTVPRPTGSVIYYCINEDTSTISTTPCNGGGGTDIWDEWWFWLIIVIIIIGIVLLIGLLIYFLLKKEKGSPTEQPQQQIQAQPQYQPQAQPQQQIQYQPQVQASPSSTSYRAF